MRLIADENMPWEIIGILRHKGFDILEVPKRTKDLDIGRLAQAQNRIILTLDKDFTNRAVFPPENFHGILRLKFHPPVIEDMLNALENLFHKLSPKNLDRKLVILEKDGFRFK